MHGDRRVTLVEPTRFPERFPPLVVALALSERVLLVVRALTRELAEAIATVELFDRPTTVAVGPEVGDEEIARALKGTRLAEAPRGPLDLVAIREQIDGWTVPPRPGPVRVPIDHAFAVRGVGAVALGAVRQGTLRVHDRLRLYPTERLVEVRSIQLHDVDVREAESGERVGVSLKGVEADELERGQTLAPDGTLAVGTEWQGDAPERCRYYRGRWEGETSMHLAVGLDVVPVRVVGSPPDGLAITAARPVAALAGEFGYLLDLSAPVPPRIAARVRLEPRARATGASGAALN